MTWYSERASKIKLGIKRGPAVFVSAVTEKFCIILFVVAMNAVSARGFGIASIACFNGPPG